ncbi:MAG TPA: enoyl-CoA hydratase/isomerase family protein [Syntrophales bacterium]|nr:enoyl-CoA hydratase/isomerase family protein [Syntrophales bacterium]
MPTMELTKEGGVYILTLINGANANTITEDVVCEYNDVLDEVEATSENAALILTSDDPKFWCNGVNLDWIVKQPHDYFPKFVQLLDELFLRFALLSMPTVGCLTGHTYAGGSVLAATLDFRVMRKDKGFFCFPEVDIKIPFSPVMYEILRLLPDHYALNELLLTGRRVGGTEALEMKIVSAVYPHETLFKKAMELATSLAKKDRRTYANIKRGLRQNLVRFTL